jgi:hypothetical protein
LPDRLVATSRIQRANNNFTTFDYHSVPTSKVEASQRTLGAGLHTCQYSDAI